MRKPGIQREAPLRARFAVRFNRLQLFKNSEEVKRIRFSNRIRLGKRLHYERWGLVCSSAHQALLMILCLAPSRAQGYRVK